MKAAVANATRVADYSHDVKRMSDYIAACGVELVQNAGPARFVDEHTIEVPDGRRFSGDAIVVAVGGHAGRLPIPGAELALTYEDIRDLTELPVSSVVIGGSDTGCQLASILVDFGSKVTVLEFADRIKPRSDHDVSAGLTAAFEAKGMQVITGTRATSIERSGDVFVVHHERDGVTATVPADTVFFAVGWPGNAEHPGSGVDRSGGRTRLSQGRTTGWSATSRTSSPPATSTGSACWCRVRGNRAWSRRRTR